MELWQRVIKHESTHLISLKANLLLVFITLHAGSNGAASMPQVCIRMPSLLPGSSRVQNKTLMPVCYSADSAQQSRRLLAAEKAAGHDDFALRLCSEGGARSSPQRGVYPCVPS